MGGIVDPKTGEVVWTLHVPVAEQVTHYHAHPPRALAGLRATPTEVGWTFDGHGEPVNVVFALACSCGGARFHATSDANEDDEVCGPIWIYCDGCEEAYGIFDPAEHGCDAELNKLPTQETDAPYDLEPRNVDASFEVVVRYEYPSDHLGDPDGQWRGREHDLYSWVTILARDPETGALEQLYESECA